MFFYFLYQNYIFLLCGYFPKPSAAWDELVSRQPCLRLYSGSEEGVSDLTPQARKPHLKALRVFDPIFALFRRFFHRTLFSLLIFSRRTKKITSEGVFILNLSKSTLEHLCMELGNYFPYIKQDWKFPWMLLAFFLGTHTFFRTDIFIQSFLK